MKVKNERVRQGAVGHVRMVEHLGRPVVEKRMADPTRHDAEVLALRALVCTDLPIPKLIRVDRGSILMTLMPGQRLDSLTPDARLTGLEASATLLHRLHDLQPPPGLPPGPDDELIVRRYSDAEGPPLPLRIPRTKRLTFCHGDWTDANLLAIDGEISAIVDWERAHLGDPIRELSRAAWAASRKDPRSFDRLVERYGADPIEVKEWLPIHAAELWLWFAEAGPPAYLKQLTAELESWPPS